MDDVSTMDSTWIDFLSKQQRVGNYNVDELDHVYTQCVHVNMRYRITGLTTVFINLINIFNSAGFIGALCDNS